MMFLAELMNVAYDKKTSIRIKGEEVELSEPLIRECKLLNRFYSFFIGCTVVFAYFLAEPLGVRSFFALLLLIGCFLAGLAMIYSFVARKLIERRLGR